MADLHAVGEDEGVVALRVVARHHQLGREVLGQQVAAEIGHAAQLGQVEQVFAAGAIDDGVAIHAQALPFTLEHGLGHGQDVVAQHTPGLQHGFAADAGATAGPGATAVGRGVGVAGADAHTVQAHAHGVGGNLRKDGLAALALFTDAAADGDDAGGLQPDRGAVLRRDARATHAVESG